MLTGYANSSGHLVPSHLGLVYVLLVEANPFPVLVFFPDYSLQTSLGTFSILLSVWELDTELRHVEIRSISLMITYEKKTISAGAGQNWAEAFITSLS